MGMELRPFTVTCATLPNLPTAALISFTMPTGLTGIVRSHCRRGLATLLKTHAIRYAKEQGIQSIRTGNEENNPMYTLNRKLGFQDLTANLAFEKEL